MSKDDEVVMCIARADAEKLFGGGLANGFQPLGRYFSIEEFEQLVNCPVHWLRRGDCENDPNFKQIIPYGVVQHNCFSDGKPHVFSYRRGAAGGEQRLKGLLSLGIGGHITKTNDSPSKCFTHGFDRELNEELVLPSYTTSIRGFVNDESTPVGQVHLGVLIDVLVESPCVYPREAEIAEACFVPLRSLPTAAADTGVEQFESWSKMLLQSNYFGEREYLEAPDVIVEVRGGVVQAAYSHDETLSVGVLDWDEYEAVEEGVELRQEAGEEVEDNDSGYLGYAESLDFVARDFYHTVY